MTKNESSTTRPLATTQDFPIVGIGASAGGLEAFRQFLTAIPENSGMAYVLVQHLYPSHESILPEILSRYTRIPVHEITNDIHLAPNTIYVIPKNKLVTSVDGVLKLSPREKESGNAAIDIFFTSLAEVHLKLAIGVVLSGTGTDGTLGLAAIRKHGGATFAQDPASAAYNQMPLNAINAGIVDYIATPKEIPSKLIGLNITNEKLLEENPDKEEENAFTEIIMSLRRSNGVDFTYYKQSTIRRRIARRMVLCKIKSYTEYLNILNENPAEPSLLFNDLLIPVTTFYRDTKVFNELKQTVFPLLSKGNKDDFTSLRIWVAGCSTGEEAYSLAIALSDYLEGDKNIQIQIFASDISQISLSKARKGFYKDAKLSNVSEDLLIKHFDRKEGGYQIKKHIRNLCIFAQHNFLKDPPFARMDLVSCRNVLIYMDSYIQKKALTTFHYALSDSGFLLLGKSETTAQAAELFIPLSKTSRIYTRKPITVRYISPSLCENEAGREKHKSKEWGIVALKNDFVQSAQAILLSDFTPSSVVVNEHMDIVHINGNVASFLELAPGPPTFNLLKIARTGLRFELRNALRKAKDRLSPVIKSGIPVRSGKDLIEVTIEIRHLKDTAEPHFLIIFTELALPEKGNTKFISLIQGQINNESVSIKRISTLEKELLQTHIDSNAIAQEHEAANVELQSANEELLSGTEELQSLNEELETSKDELQSSNEELILINTALLEKQDQADTTNYIGTIIETLREPVAILDKNFYIKNINGAFTTLYGISNEEAKTELIYNICNGIFKNAMMRSLLESELSRNEQIDNYQIIINHTPTDKERILTLNARLITQEQSKEQLIFLAFGDTIDKYSV
jgi:two-component system CheB/CheR fusion protein